MPDDRITLDDGLQAAGAFKGTPSTLPYQGIIKPGNLNPFDRPVLHNSDGSYSTTRSMSIGTKDGEVLIPTVVNGKQLSNQQAIDNYRKTGQHLGIFDTPEHADAFATALHNQQAKRIKDGKDKFSKESGVSNPITFNEAYADYEAAKRPGLVSHPSQIVTSVGPLDTEDPSLGMVSPRASDIQPASRSNFGASLESNLVEDEQTKLGILAKRLFPNDPNGIKRVGIVDGNPVFVNDHGKLEHVSGGFTRAVAGAVANAPEIGLGIAGSFAGSPIAGSAIAATGGRAAKRIAANLIYGEPQTPLGNAVDLLKEGAINTAGGYAGKGIAKLAGRARIVDFSPSEIKTAEQARAYVKQTTGIDLDLAQASGSRKLLALRDFASRYPGKTADMIQAQDEIASGQFDAAVHRVLDMVATSKPSEIAGRNAVNAAQATIAGARQGVQNQVRPLYQAAYDAVPLVDRTTAQGRSILDFLRLPYFPEAFASGQKLRALENGTPIPKTRSTETLSRGTPEDYSQATTTIDSTQTGARVIKSRTVEGTRTETPTGRLHSRNERTDTDITGPSLAELDYTKRALDEIIDGMMAGDKPQRQRALFLGRQRDQFVAELDALPNQQWQLARGTYGRLISDYVTPIENSAVGALAKVKDSQLAHAGAKILGDYGVSKEQAALTRTLLSQREPEAYRGLVRQYIADAYDTAQKITQGGDAINPAGKLRQQLFGTPSKAATTRNLLPPDAAQAFDDLMLAAEKLAQTPLGASRVAGSNTARDLNISEALKSRGVSFAKFLTAPLKTISGNAASGAERKAQEQGIESLTEALLDPAKRGQLKQILRIKDSTKQTLLIGALLSSQAVKIAASDIGETRTPPAYTQPGQ